MKRLQELYPDKRIERKQEELDRLATSYVEKLFAYLPCLDLADDYDKTTANIILMLAISIQQGQQSISGEATQSLQGSAEEAKAPQLTETQRVEMAALIRQYGIYAAQESGDGVIYITHPLIQGRAQALSEVELYEIVQDIAAQMTAAQ